jgi:hypothetical protein
VLVKRPVGGDVVAYGDGVVTLANAGVWGGGAAV